MANLFCRHCRCPVAATAADVFPGQFVYCWSCWQVEKPVGAARRRRHSNDSKPSIIDLDAYQLRKARRRLRWVLEHGIVVKTYI